MIVQIKLLCNIYENTFCSPHHLNFKVHHALPEYHSYSIKKKMFLVIEILQYRALCLHARDILLGFNKGIDLDLAIFDSYNFLVLVMNDWIYKRHSPKHLKFCFVTIDFNFRTLQKISLYIWRINCVNWNCKLFNSLIKVHTAR